MGCLCSKEIYSGEFADNNRRKKELSKSSKRLTSSLRRDEVAVIVDNNGVDATESLISKQPSEENAPSEHVLLKEEIMSPGIEERAMVHAGKLINLSSNRFQPQLSRNAVMPNGIQGAQIAAGWPAWLTAVAGEAIKGWVPRKAESFAKLDKIGQGTYSSVYRGRDLESGKIVAMKKVRFVNMDPESVRFMAREIIILRRLDHPNVMKLEGLVTSRVSGSLYLIFQYMEHDLAGLAATPGIRFTESQIKCYMQQLLMGLEHCHNCGVLHRDIKGSNLLIDNNGNMKIGDFGLSTFFHTNQKQPLTSRVVTLWYRPPELLLGSTDYSIGVDLWSAGCILAELFYGKPIMPGRTEVEQLHKIFKLCGSPSEEYWRKSKLPHATIFKPQNPYKRCVNDVFVNFPPSALALLDILLAIEPEKRGSASSALQSEFFRTTPLPCSPTTLPKYPPSKEFDAKLRDDEVRRKKAAAGKARGSTSSLRSGSQDSKALPAPDANAESLIAIQKRKGQANTKSTSEKYNIEEDGGTGFPMGPSGGPNLLVQRAQFLNPNAYGSLVENGNRTPMAPQDGSEVGVRRFHMHQGTIGLSRFSNSVAVRGDTSDMDTNSSWAVRGPSRPRYSHLDGAESSKWFHALLDRPKSSHKKEKHAPGKQSSTGFSASKRIHYSGPLLPPGGNLEEMLKEHERQIQHAVRKARLGKTKMKKAYGENGPGDSLLNHVSGNGR